MPEENSIFMKTSSRALGILTQLHSETAQAMYAYTVGRQQGANEMALSNAILAERLIGCYRVIPSLLGSPHARKNIEHIMQDEIPVEVGFTEDGLVFPPDSPTASPKGAWQRLRRIHPGLFGACHAALFQ